VEEDLDWLAVKFEVARFLLSAAVDAAVVVVVDGDVDVDEDETDRTVAGYICRQKGLLFWDLILNVFYIILSLAFAFRLDTKFNSDTKFNLKYFVYFILIKN
jgi:hypothetical protein